MLMLQRSKVLRLNAARRSGRIFSGFRSSLEVHP
jgi:hypothetical protein